MRAIEFSEVQVFNLSALLTLRDCVQQDLIAACCTFGLSAEQARTVSALSVDEVLLLIQHLGQESLFLPRQNLTALLELPAALAGPITSVHPPRLTTTPDMASHGGPGLSPPERSRE